MGKKTMVWIVTATILVIVGVALLAVALMAVEGDFMLLSTVKYVTNTHVVSEDFHSIRLDVDTADVEFALSEDGDCKVVCREEEKAQHSVVVSDETLKIQVRNEKAWYDHIRIGFSSPQITVYLPEAAYQRLDIHADTGAVEIPGDFQFEALDVAVSTGDVTVRASVSGEMAVKTSTGRIRVENIQVGALTLTASTGRILVSGITCQGDVRLSSSTGKTVLTDVVCENLTSVGDTGDISLTRVIARATMTLKRDTGDVLLEGVDAAQIRVETDTGDVRGSILTNKVFDVHADTGSVHVPESEEGGLCYITTDTGDIRISISQNGKG